MNRSLWLAEPVENSMGFCGYLGNETIPELSVSADSNCVRGIVFGFAALFQSRLSAGYMQAVSAVLDWSDSKAVLFSFNWSFCMYSSAAGTESDRFTGKPVSATTGLYYYFQRWYDPSIGRFISVDPLTGDLSDPQSLNPYVYVSNQPTGAADPTGFVAYSYNMSNYGKPASCRNGPNASKDYWGAWWYGFSHVECWNLASAGPMGAFGVGLDVGAIGLEEAAAWLGPRIGAVALPAVVGVTVGFGLWVSGVFNPRTGTDVKGPTDHTIPTGIVAPALAGGIPGPLGGIGTPRPWPPIPKPEPFQPPRGDELRTEFGGNRRANVICAAIAAGLGLAVGIGLIAPELAKSNNRLGDELTAGLAGFGTFGAAFFLCAGAAAHL